MVPEWQESKTSQSVAPVLRMAVNASANSLSVMTLGMLRPALGHLGVGGEEDLVAAVLLGRVFSRRRLVRAVTGELQEDEVALLRLGGDLAEFAQDRVVRREFEPFAGARAS